jgi:arylformamidase
MLVYPDDPPVVLEWEARIERGDEVSLSRISMGLHAGTHVDAPLHLYADGAPIDKVPLDCLVGLAQVIVVGNEKSIGASDVEGRLTEQAGIVLFKTRNSALWASGRFSPGHVFLSSSAARYLMNAGVRAVGIDYLSVDGPGDLSAHAVLLGAGIPVIEGLDLSAVGEGLYECICLPLSMEGREAAPARVIVRPLNVAYKSG